MVAFLRPFYIERIAQEQNLDSLDELKDESQLDWSKAGTPGTGKQSAHVPTRQTEAVAPKKSSKAWVGVAAVAVLGVGGFGVFKATQKHEDPKTIEVPHIPVDDGKTVVVKPIEPLKLRVESDPIGADVEQNGNRVGVTPIDLSLERARLPATLKVSRDGFEPKETIVTEASPPLVSLQLTKKKARTPGLRQPEIKTNR
jgi:hypothetical protein